MKYALAGSCTINQFEKLDFQKKIEEILSILKGVKSMEIYLKDKNGYVQATVKTKLKINKEAKVLKFRSKGKSKPKVIDRAIVKLSKKYFKFSQKHNKVSMEKPYKNAG